MVNGHATHSTNEVEVIEMIVIVDPRVRIDLQSVVVTERGGRERRRWRAGREGRKGEIICM